MFSRHPPPAGERNQCVGCALADLLGPDPDYLDQVPPVHHPLRQQRGRRHPGAAGLSGTVALAPHAETHSVDCTRAVRRGAALWRQHDHAGHFRTQRGGRAGSAGPPTSGICGAGNHRDPVPVIPVPASRDRRGGLRLRADHACLVCDPCRIGDCRHRGQPHGSASRSTLCTPCVSLSTTAVRATWSSARSSSW